MHATDAGLKADFHSSAMGSAWVRRFNEKRLSGLEDRQRPGRKPTHPPEVRSSLVALGIQKPSTLGYPFELWTLERLQRVFKECHGIHLSDSTIWE